MPTSAEVIKAMDEISNTVCCVVDSAELCRHTHPNREFVEEANKASMRINEYLHHLNTNHTLFDAVRKDEQEGHLLTHEAQRVAHYLRIDFERGGIHLPADKLDRVNHLNIKISQLCREFNENIIMDPGTVDIFPASRIPQNLHHLLDPIYHSRSTSLRESHGHMGAMKEKGFCIPTDPHTLSSVLQWASDQEVKREVYHTNNKGALPDCKDHIYLKRANEIIGTTTEEVVLKAKQDAAAASSATAKLQDIYEKFCKVQANHLQALKCIF